MEDWLTDLIASKRSDGIIVIGQSTEHSALESVADKYLPLVVWGGQIDHQSYCTVGSDNVGGGRMATEHLITLGRRRIVFVGDTRVPEFKLRYRGYSQALDQAPSGTAKRKTLTTHMAPDRAFESMMAFIQKGEEFDGVICATDIIAISVIRALAASGRRVPDDVSVVGYDDLAIAAQTFPPLTTVRQNIEQGATHLVDLLFRRMEGEATGSITMAPELIVRDSSKPA
jgi:DNA-binding LacI/PurR family transcriptional regulator